MLRRSFRLMLVSLFLIPACGTQDHSSSDEFTETEPEFAEGATAEDREAFQRSVLEYVEALQDQISHLEDDNTLDPATVRALKAQTARIHESIRELDDVTAVAYRDLHSEIQNRLYRLEANITKATLRSADQPEELQKLARKRLDTLGTAINAFVETVRRRGENSQTPHAVDPGKLKKQYSRLAQRISAVDRDTVSIPKARSEIANDLADLLLSVRKANNLVEHPEIH